MHHYNSVLLLQITLQLLMMIITIYEVTIQSVVLLIIILAIVRSVYRLVPVLFTPVQQFHPTYLYIF